MNQIQTLIDTIREVMLTNGAHDTIQTLIDTARKAMTSNSPHDTILAVGIAAIPVLIVCLIINRLRHPDRSFLAAVGVSLLGFFLVPSVAGGTAILWVRTGGADGQAIGVGIVLCILGFWMFRQWLRSAPRSARRQGLPTPSREMAALRDEVARIRADRRDRAGEDVA